MIFRSRSPFRLGLAGGGTDVSPYSDLYGGAILNATISLYVHTHIQTQSNKEIKLISIDQNIEACFKSGEPIQAPKGLDLQAGVYNYLLRQNMIGDQGCILTTKMDVAAGSGLGTSSTLVVGILKAFSEMLNIPYGDYDLAHLAYTIERQDLQLAGGKQDQYAATFGGVNFMEFFANDKVIVNPLRIKTDYLLELENNIVLYFTSSSRESSMIIKEQQKNVSDKNQSSIEAMHQLKEQSYRMKEALLTGQLNEIGEILDFGFEQKRKMANNISNSILDEIYNEAKAAGAAGGKISGAGGGGFMFFYCPGTTKYNVIQALQKFNGKVIPFQFTKHGAISWKA